MAPQIIFIGMPGVGKSTVARALAARRHLATADSDALIVQHMGMQLPEIFDAYGEDGFRRIEEQVIANALNTFDGILSLGGGAVVSAQTRAALAHHNVVLIDGSDSLLVHRVTKSHTVRPLLAEDPVAGINRLRKERSHLYYSCARHVVMTGNGSLEEVVNRVEKLLDGSNQIVTVEGEQPYDVVIGHNLVIEAVRAVEQYAKTMIVYSPDVTSYVHNYLEVACRGAGVSFTSVELPRGEAAKDYSTIEALWDAAGDARIGRDGVVLTVGGGATTDVGGFFASTWLRGIPVVHMPTTVLAMVDAAVGGKTGINTPHGKNLVGAFYPPLKVLCDLDVLTTLPMNDIRAGFGEIVKCGFIADPEILHIVSDHGQSLLHADSEYLPELLCRAIQVKAQVVGEDLRESGLREILNYGHTLAHAIERNENYRVRHGDAVAIGCVFAAALAEISGHAESGLVQHHRSILKTLDLPVSYAGTSRAELVNAMYSDKKVRDGHLRFVVLDSIAQPSRLEKPTSEMMSYAFDAIGL